MVIWSDMPLPRGVPVPLQVKISDMYLYLYCTYFNAWNKLSCQQQKVLKLLPSNWCVSNLGWQPTDLSSVCVWPVFPTEIPCGASAWQTRITQFWPAAQHFPPKSWDGWAPDLRYHHREWKNGSNPGGDKKKWLPGNGIFRSTCHMYKV